MRISKIYKALPLLMLAVVGCSKDFLDRVPKDEIASETFWQSVRDTELALNGCYAYVGASVYDAYVDAYADNSYCQYPWESKATVISAGDINATMNDGYNYEGIRRFNYFLDNVDKSPTPEDVKKQYVGEVKVLRAWNYYNLAKKFGAVPLIKEFTLNPEDVAVAPASEEEVMNFVIAELEEAIPNLPDENEYKSRISKASALVLKARVHLFRQEWNEAAAAAQEVMGMGYQLFSVASLSDEDTQDDYSTFVDFADEDDREKFYKGLSSYEQLFWEANEGNAEVIMEAEYIEESQWEYSSGINTLYLADNAGGGWSSVTPTQSMVNAYWDRSGETFVVPTPEERATRYNSGNFSDEYLNEFKNRDTRLYASILYPGALWGHLEPGYVFSWDKGGSNISKTGYNYRKMADPSENAQSGQWKGPQNFPIMRYAEVLLIYAEAKNEVSGPDATVYDAIDLIRERVGMPVVDRDVYSSKDLLREVIRNERRIELAGEGFRWDDMRRWNIGSEVMNSIYSIDNDLAQQRIWNDKYVRLPYPQTAVDRNPNLQDAQSEKGY
ncbi:RagB/SusD family nutrient uptake outer membrane protein [Zhouia spongiae]|uniref:RagB/SusD family nutrient uptake outer membrane protein n=1 Tax=Zhouia spongiae TaxID=2202721 RepID=A0ABY3YH93_9FLAO|nr:RagB/SusD family nutrient uptake outer membrane protein [Zhouia spongiae]UNY97306.1 RagB/SusD family nutrient uptake outer membrane protein [Zhouia spongiae]